ncbi:MAG: hypothetical protein QOI24_1400 [Acidobacteriota bacterium]|jgi:hypothetical protein|nr:hypothetical protein [Acidobacteriota bacterium]
MPMYPKQVARLRVPVKEKTCFVLMPFASEFNTVYAEIKDCLSTIDFDCKRADDIFASTAIIETVMLSIRSSQIVIADLSTRNPNVFYELGFTHATKENPMVILICQNIAEVPIDLRHNLIIQYNPANLKGLNARLTASIRDNRAFFEGRARLSDRYHWLLGTGDDLERVVEYLDSYSRTFWDLILIAFGLADRDDAGDHGVSATFFAFRDSLNQVLATGEVILHRNLYQIFVDLAIHLLSVPAVREFAVTSLQDGQVDQLRCDEATGLECMMDFAIAAYSHPELKREALRWIFEYLRRRKVAGIDLKRSKAEAFVLKKAVSDREVKDQLFVALADRDHMKEVAADALGELRHSDAVPHLVLALHAERSNPYVARSIFSALGKIAAAAGGQPIVDWSRDNIQWLTEQKLEFVWDHAREALSAIDAANGTKFVGALAAVRLGAKRRKKVQSRPLHKRQQSD